MRDQTAKNKSYYDRNKDSELSRSRSWAQANPERRTLSNIKARAKKRGHTFSLSLEHFQDLFESTCHYCGGDGVTGFDRVDSAVGYEPDNVVPCCPTCNYAKRDMSVETFLAWVKRVNDFSNARSVHSTIQQN